MLVSVCAMGRREGVRRRQRHISMVLVLASIALMAVATVQGLPQTHIPTPSSWRNDKLSTFNEESFTLLRRPDVTYQSARPNPRQVTTPHLMPNYSGDKDNRAVNMVPLHAAPTEEFGFRSSINTQARVSEQSPELYPLSQRPTSKSRQRKRFAMQDQLFPAMNDASACPFIPMSVLGQILFGHGHGLKPTTCPPRLLAPDCPSYGSCHGHCGELRVTDRHDVRDQGDFPCSCDRLCWIYGDCCYDFYFWCLRLSIFTSPVRFLEASLESLSAYSQALDIELLYMWKEVTSCVPSLGSTAPLFYQMVTKCSHRNILVTRFLEMWEDISVRERDGQTVNMFQGLSRSDIVVRCESLDRSPNKHPLNVIHVSHKDLRTVHFYNVFCAICNGVSPEHVEQWNATLSCPEVGHITWTPRGLLDTIKNLNCVMTSRPGSDQFVRTCVPTDCDDETNIKVSLAEDDGVGGGGGKNDHSFKDGGATKRSMKKKDGGAAKRSTQNGYSCGSHQGQQKMLTTTGLDRHNMVLYGVSENQKKSAKQNSPTRTGRSDVRNISHRSSLGNIETPFRNTTIDAILCERYIYAFTTYANGKIFRHKNPHCLTGSVLNSSLYLQTVPLFPVLPSEPPTMFSLFNGDLVKCNKSTCGCLPPSRQNHVPNKHGDLGIGFQIKPGDHPNSQPPSMVSFPVLMDFRSPSHMLTINDTLLNPEMRTCPEGQAFVPLYSSCVATLRPKEHNLQHRECHETDPFSDHSVTPCPVQNGTYDGEEHVLPDIDSNSSLVLHISFSHIVDEIKNCLDDNTSSCAFVDEDQTEQRQCVSNCVSESASLNRSANEIRGNKYTLLPRLSGTSHCSLTCLLHRAFLTYTWVSLRSGTEDLEGDTVKLGDKLATSIDFLFAERWNISVTAAELFSCKEQNCWKRELLPLNLEGMDLDVHNISDYMGKEDKQINELANSTSLFTSSADAQETVVNSTRESNVIVSLSTLMKNSYQPKYLDSTGASTGSTTSTPGTIKRLRSNMINRKPGCEGNKTSRTLPCTSGACLRLEVKLDINEAFERSFLSSLSDLLKTFKAYATDNNFVLKSFDVFSPGSLDKVKCPIGTKVEFIEKVLSIRNGTYIVQVTDKLSVSLNTVAFRLSVNQSQILSLLSRNQVTIKVGLCLRKPIRDDFSCEKYLLYNQTDLLLFNGMLIVTRNQEEVQNILDQASTSLELTHNASFEQVRILLDSDMEAGDFLVYDRHSYDLTDDGAVVCSHYNGTFDVTVKSRFMTIVWLPESQSELLATQISLTLSLVCLAFVLVVYGVLPELRNTPGKILMSFCASLMTGQLMYLLAGYPRGLACVLHASLLHASWLSAFCWLTAMSGDLAYVLTAQSRGHMGVCRGVKAFTRYSVVCWGGPAIFTGLCVSLDSSGLVSLGYGAHDRCWLGNLTSLLVTFCLPALLLLSASFSCALVTAKAIRISAQFQRASRSTCRRNRSRMWLCLSLSLLLGVSWLLYVPAVLVNTTFLWTPHILLTGSQGLYVIACFVMRKPVLQKLSARFCSNRKYQNDRSSKGQRQISEPGSNGKIQTVSTPELTSPPGTAVNAGTERRVPVHAW